MDIAIINTLLGREHNITLLQECIRAALIFVFGLTMLRLSGRRTFAEWSALDTILTVIAGSALSRAMTASAPFAGTLAAVALLVGLHVLFAWGVTHSKVLSVLIEGSPIQLGRNGHIDETLRKHNLVFEADLGEALRCRGIEHPSEAKSITLEPSGRITVVKI